MPTVSITRNFWQSLSDEYGIDVRFVRLLDVQLSDVNWCDILVMIRPNNAYAWRIAAATHKTGRFVITMCDDDLLHLPKSHPDLPWQKGGLIKALRYSNALMSCNRYLIDQMSGLTLDGRSSLVDTVVRPEEILDRDYDSEGGSAVRIVYAAGGGQHEALFEQLVLPALLKVATQNPNKITLTFVSVHPQCDELEKIIPVTYVDGMPLLEYRKYMEDQKFDIGISPLEDTSFSKCKYFNKYLEYTLSGIVGIYSNVQPYTFVVQDGFNGFLADNTDKAWEEKLSLAILDSNLRKACAKRAQKHVVSSFAERVLMERMFADIPELRKNYKGHSSCRNFFVWRIQYLLLRYAEYLYKVFFYIKSEGFNSVKKKLFSRFKRK